MTRLSTNSWGKSSVRVSKVHRGTDADDFSDVTVAVQLSGDVEAAYTAGDNAGVLPTDTVRNTIYAFAQDHLTHDLEDFGGRLADHFLAKEGIVGAVVEIQEHRWQRHSGIGFVGTPERRTMRLTAPQTEVWAGIGGLVVLKTTESAFSGYPRDEYTILPETDDRILATTVNAEWRYEPVPGDTTETWDTVRSGLLEGFFGGWSASVQHQGWQMGNLVLERVPEITEISFRLPNQHHIGFDLARFGVDDRRIVFQPTSEPYGDIRFTLTRS